MTRLIASLRADGTSRPSASSQAAAPPTLWHAVMSSAASSAAVMPTEASNLGFVRRARGGPEGSIGRYLREISLVRWGLIRSKWNHEVVAEDVLAVTWSSLSVVPAHGGR